MTDSLGRKIDFKNTIIIMTSNIGSRQLSDFGKGVGFNTKARDESGAHYSKSVIQNALKKAFSPEFLNRVDDVIIFDALTRESIHKIIEIELQQLYGRVEDLGYELKINDQAKDFIVEKGYDEKFGARPLKRAIQKYVEDPLAEEIIKTKLKEGDVISISLNKNGEELNIKVSKPKVKAKVSKNNGAPKAKNNLGKGASDKKAD